jgi:hypothetical protein
MHVVSIIQAGGFFYNVVEYWEAVEDQSTSYGGT